MNIPLVDLARQHAQIEAEVADGIASVFKQGDFIRGGAVSEFEEAFAAFCEVGHCVGVGSGTDAIELAVRALGLGAGDEVILPANSFIASALGVLRAGVGVKLVDSDPVTHLIDIGQVSDAISRATRAVMPVHLYGQMADMRALLDAAEGLLLIEDAAQAQGARHHGATIGSLGTVAATSFYPGKNIGAYGDAGAVLSTDESISDAVRALGNWGSDVKYHHPVVGFNSRLDTIQAVVLAAKLRRLADWNEQRRAAAVRYGELLEAHPTIELPTTAPGNDHVWHLYVVQVGDRDNVLQHLHAHGIGAGIHYPIPMHLQPALASLGYGPGDFPVAERAAERMLSLPLFPGITETEQERVVEVLAGATANG